MQPVTLTIEPNEKYREVIDGYAETDGEAWTTDSSNNNSITLAADAYAEAVETAPEPPEAEPLETLSWDHFSVSRDPDLVAKMATYFDGMEPDEPTARIRAKLRLLDCEVYADVQIAARAELQSA